MYVRSYAVVAVQGGGRSWPGRAISCYEHVEIELPMYIQPLSPPLCRKEEATGEELSSTT